MSITQSQRYEMHEVLREKLGVSAADTLIEHLPPEGWGNVATKKDVALARKDLGSEIAQLRSEMIQMEERIMMKLDLAIKEAFAKQNKWMFGILVTMNITLAVAMMR